MAKNIVYLAKNKINGGEYVGLSNRSLATRRHEHEIDAANKQRSTCRAFHAALRKYGTSSFEWSIIAEYDDRDEAVVREIAEIASRQTRYNITAGGPGVIAPRTKEWRLNISKALTGRKPRPEEIEKSRAARPSGLGERAVVCLEDLMVFPSIKAAAAALGVKPRAISRALHNQGGQRTAGGKHFILESVVPLDAEERLTRLLDVERLAFERRSHRAKAVVCINTQKLYASGTAAAAELGMSQMTVSNICRTGGQSRNGLRFRFADGEEIVRQPRSADEIEAGRRSRVEKLKARRHPPETIERMRIAAKKRGVSAVTIAARVASMEKPILCVETGATYRNARDAGAAHGLARGAIYALIRKGGRSTSGMSFRHL